MSAIVIAAHAVLAVVALLVLVAIVRACIEDREARKGAAILLATFLIAGSLVVVIRYWNEQPGTAEAPGAEVSP